MQLTLVQGVLYMKIKILISKIRIILVFLLLISMTFVPKSWVYPALPAIGVSANDITVSGLSSGGFMAGQFHVAFSSQVSGVGIFSAGPYLCARGNLGSAVSKCSSSANSLTDSYIEELVQETSKLAVKGKIDNISNLQSDKVFIYHGDKDPTVKVEAANKIQLWYQLAGVQKENIYLKIIKGAGHAFPTNGFGNKCEVDTEPPWVSNCKYDGAQAMMSHLFENIEPAVDSVKGEIIEFDQTEFFGDELNGMASSGFVYIPKQCKKEQCKVHVFFHGCQQGYSIVPKDRKNDNPKYDSPPYQKIGKTLVENLGFNQIAGANNIVVLYPQLKKSTKSFNPRSCYDFWGYAKKGGLNYATKDGAQLGAVMRMVQRLSGEK